MENDEKDKDDLPDKEDKETDLEETLRKVIREEISADSRRSFRRDRPPRPPRPPRKPHDISIRIDEDWEDWGERFGRSFEHYIGGILDSIGDTLDRTVGSIFQTSPSSRRQRRRKKDPFFIPEDELESFFQKGASIMAALSDQTRLRMLKELEKKPLRQSDLSERTNTRGGNFKHHITILKDEGLVRQEGVRERYILTFSGREALKLVEFLYTSAQKRIKVPIYSTDDEDEELDDFPEEEE
ncbi:MAG: ArsR/SmtB family transcription factor [Promethearchaeota archaeon]